MMNMMYKIFTLLVQRRLEDAENKSDPWHPREVVQKEVTGKRVYNVCKYESGVRYGGWGKDEGYAGRKKIAKTPDKSDR